MTGKSIELRFGVLQPKIEEQLKDQGFEYKDKAKVEYFEGLRDSVHRLTFGGLLTDSEINKLFTKLLKKITKEIKVIF